MKHKTDEELVARIQEGEISAYESLVKKYQNKVFHFVSRIVFDRMTAEEVVQDAFFACYRSIHRIDVNRRFTTYLFEIARNTAISRLRSQKKTVPLDDNEIALDETVYDYLGRKETQSIVHHAMRLLSSEHREIIQLYYFEDLSYEEIGKKVHIPLNTVRSRLLRAKEKLKAYIPYEVI